VGYRIFLSHTARDANWANWVRQEAARISIEVYMFEHDPQPGRDLAEKVKNAIRMCDAVVVLLTPNSENAPYVQQEIGFAQGIPKLVIPLVWPGVNARSFAMLQGKEFVTFDPRQATTALKPVLDYIGRLKNQKELGQAILGIAAIVLVALGIGKK
jgi:hypothetical protein